MAFGYKRPAYSKSANGVSRTYVDAHYFLSLIYDEDDAQDARRLFSRLNHSIYRVLLPQIMLGEIVAKILDKSDKGSLMDDFGRLCTIFFKYGISVEKCLPGIGANVPRIMLDIQRLDERLMPNDAMILSEVLADPDSKFFFTNDRDILMSLKIKQYERDLFESGSRNTRLKIRGSL